MYKITPIKLDDIPKEVNFSFAKNTTYRLGGAAAVAYFPKSIRQSVALCKYLKSNDINFFVLGNGSDVLASDSGYEGVVVGTKNLNSIYRTGADTIFCQSGVKVTALLKYCIERGFGGLEFLAGIPATIGGLVYMNGGAGGKVIGDKITKVKLFDGKMRNFSNKQCNFGNKYSTMRDINCLILGAELKIDPKSGENVAEEVASYLKTRSGQPKGASCGCVFKNYKNQSAGKIIDELGLKGLSVGNAVVSAEHANFIINNGASASDVRKLIEEIKRKVYEKSGIILEEEVVYIGDFNDTFS